MEDRVNEFLRRLSEWSKTSMNWYRFSFRKAGRGDPYKSLILTIMLQRTRAEMVERAHKRFFDRFPTFESLAEANVRTITRALKGVGLSRVKAKRLKRLAQEILRIGELPSTRDGLVRLPGVGRYTASIVSCLTFGRPVVAVDVNVIRILKRMGFIEREEEAEPFLEGALDEDQRRWFNKALLEFGMSICRPKPRCERCPMVDICSFEPLKPT